LIFKEGGESFKDRILNSWHKIYQISTIGHEFGHILWVDDDTESLMNGSGAFKNIEEFKATAGGLVSIFYKGDDTLYRYIVDDLVTLEPYH